jgi:hypothetical protein
MRGLSRWILIGKGTIELLSGSGGGGSVDIFCELAFMERWVVRRHSGGGGGVRCGQVAGLDRDLGRM